jgi:hypothetical protein
MLLGEISSLGRLSIEVAWSSASARDAPQERYRVLDHAQL